MSGAFLPLILNVFLEIMDSIMLACAPFLEPTYHLLQLFNLLSLLCDDARVILIGFLHVFEFRLRFLHFLAEDLIDPSHTLYVLDDGQNNSCVELMRICYGFPGLDAQLGWQRSSC